MKNKNPEIPYFLSYITQLCLQVANNGFEQQVGVFLGQETIDKIDNLWKQKYKNKTGILWFKCLYVLTL